MIDWITALIPCTHEPLKSGLVCKIDADGVQEWATPCRTIIEGSHEAKITVTSDGSDGKGNATHLKVSGNPSKYLQGHNIFGSDDLVPLMNDTFNKVTGYLSLNPTITEIKAVKEGAYRITCIDINHSYELNSRTDVLAWLRASEFKSKTRHGRPSTKGGTVYWGKHSKRWALKAYCKAEEIQAPKHKLPTSLIDTPLIPWVENKLRIELRLKSKLLDEIQLSEAKNWTKETTNRVFQEYLGRLQMTEQMKITDEQLLQLPQRIRSTESVKKSV